MSTAIIPTSTLIATQPRSTASSFLSHFSPKDIDTAHAIFNEAWGSLETKFGRGEVDFPSKIMYLVGPPAVGKGTHTPAIAQERGYNPKAIVISDLFKDPANRTTINNGHLVDDKTVTFALFDAMTKEAYIQSDSAILDGFPRSNVQAIIAWRLSLKLGAGHAAEILEIFCNQELSDHRQKARGEKALARKESPRPTDINPEARKGRYLKYVMYNKKMLAALATQIPLYSVTILDNPEAAIEDNRALILKAMNSPQPSESVGVRI